MSFHWWSSSKEYVDNAVWWHFGSMMALKSNTIQGWCVCAWWTMEASCDIGWKMTSKNSFWNHTWQLWHLEGANRQSATICEKMEEMGKGNWLGELTCLWNILFVEQGLVEKWQNKRTLRMFRWSLGSAFFFGAHTEAAQALFVTTH